LFLSFFKAKGWEDGRDMFPEAIRCIRELEPKAFLFENVKGLLRSSFKDYLRYILLQLAYPEIVANGRSRQGHYGELLKIKEDKAYTGLRYDVTLNLVNAAGYGVPQKRERVIIVDVRRDLDIQWRLPKPTHSMDSLMWEKYVTESYWQKHNVSPSDAEYELFPSFKLSLTKKTECFPLPHSPGGRFGIRCRMFRLKEILLFLQANILGGMEQENIPATREVRSTILPRRSRPGITAFPEEKIG